MKKCLLVATGILLSLLMIISIAADRDYAKIDGSVTEETVTVNISIDAPYPIYGCSFNLVYDNDTFELVNAQRGEVFSGTTVINDSFRDNAVKVSGVSVTELARTGVVLSAEFKLKSDSFSGIVEFYIEEPLFVREDFSKESFDADTLTLNIEAKDTDNSDEDDRDNIYSDEDDEDDKKNYYEDDDAYDYDKDFEDSTTYEEDEAKSAEPADEKEEKPYVMLFGDVNKNAWYYDSVAFVNKNGLMNGVSTTKFSPDSTLTRAMLVTIIYRLEGEPVSSKAEFTDVAQDAWYSKAVAWASENNIVNGVEYGVFAPDRAITREQLATILHRYIKYKKVASLKMADLDKYTDAHEIGMYALEAMSWASGSGVMSGTSDTTLSPGMSATRAQVAVILERFSEIIK